MSHKRLRIPESWPRGKEFTSDLITLGYQFALQPIRRKDTVKNNHFVAVEAGPKNADERHLSLSVDWIEIPDRVISSGNLICNA